MQISYRSERPSDHKSIDQLLEEAFGGSAEAELVRALRLEPAYLPHLSIIQVEENLIVGYLMLSSARISKKDGYKETLALAPMAILPSAQRIGLGSKLVVEVLDRAAQLGHDSVVVLGHAEYYPKFGFQPASSFGISCPWDVSDEVFMAIELSDGALADCNGMMEYAAPFYSM